MRSCSASTRRSFATVGYAFGNAVPSLDLLGGVRYWNLSTTLDVDRATRPSNSHSISQQWVDATGGLRIRLVPYPRVRFTVAGDAGGGGSQETRQASAAAEYDAWTRVTIGVEYRALDVHYDRNDFLFDTRTSGVVIGATFRLR